jgi:iron complex outermembrane recepter protein
MRLVSKAFVAIGASHSASTQNAPQNYPDGASPAKNPPTTTLLRYTIPGYTIFDAALGVSKDNWSLQIQGTNITNTYGPTNITSAQFIKAEVPLRPRVLMAELSYHF